MPSYRPNYANTDDQPVNSRHSSQRVVRGSRRHHHNEPRQDVQQTNEQGNYPHASNNDIMEVDIYQIVDSWRSYRNNDTNLQSMHGTNPAATVFQPTHQSNAPIQLQRGLSQSSRSVQHDARYIPYPTDKSFRGRNVPPVRQPRQQATMSTFASGGAHNLYQSTIQYSNMVGIANPSRESVHTSSIPAPRNLAALREHHAHHPANPPPPIAPQATEAYKAQARLLPYSLTSPQKLLVILDLNGTLVYRKARNSKPTSIRIRPGVTQLLDYLFTNHVVMIYTSARPQNALGMTNQLLHPRQRNKLAGVWARDQLDLTVAQYNAKVQVYKKLDKVWNDQKIQASHPSRQSSNTWFEGSKEWDQTNTVLVDDSLIKGMSHPHNLLQVPEFVNDKPDEKQGMEAMNFWSKNQQDILKGLQAKIEVLKWTGDVSRAIRMWQAGEEEVPTFQGQGIVVQESVDQGKAVGQAIKRIGSSSKNGQLPTSRSSLQDDDDDDEDDAGAPIIDEEVSKLNQYFGQNSLEDNGGVSPVDETVFQELLGGRENEAGAGGSNARGTPQSTRR